MYTHIDMYTYQHKFGNIIKHKNILDVSVSYVAQLDIAGSGIQVLDNDALASSAGVEALGLMSNRLSSIGDKSLL